MLAPWRLAAGLYDYVSGRLLCWTTLLLPFSSADAHRFQTQREYLGHLLSVLLIVAYKTSSAPTHGTTSYQWVNDNTGAVAWVNANKCSSLASSFACMAVSQLNMLTDVWAADTIHIPGKNMGEIDAMSRLEAQADSLTAFPTLTSLTYYNLESPSVRTLFSRCRSEFPRRASSYFLGCCFFNLRYYYFLLDSVVPGQARYALVPQVPIAGNGRFELIRSLL